MKNVISISFLLLSLSSCAIFGQQSAKHTVEKCGFLPHCVSSKDDRERFKIPGHKYSGTKIDMHNKILAYLRKQENVTIKKIAKNYIHAVYSSKLMGFKDDVEFEVQEEIVHIRSISRIGISDLGVNRERVNKILKVLSQK